MAKTEKMIPKMRFKQFMNCDAWEQRKLSQVATLTSSKRVHAEDYVDSGIPFYRGKEITELRENKVVSELLYIATEKYEEIDRMYGSPKIGDVLITAVGTIGNTWVVDKTPFYFKDGNLIWFKNIKCDPMYLDYVLNSPDGRVKVMNSAIGSNQKALTMIKLNEIEITIPRLEEQEKIGAFFATLDNLITLHQHKLEKVQAMKKAYLTEMFPQNGESVPKRRFAGYNDDWEQCKLNNIVDIVMGQSPDGSTYTNTPSDHILVQGNADLKDGWVYPRIWTTQATKKANAGDLIMSVRAPAGEMAKTAYNVVLGRGVAAIKGNEFIFQSLLKMNDDGYWKKLSSGSTFDSLNSDNIKNTELLIPTQREQERIGKFFINLDNLITLHQHKLEKLKNLKKSYLNELFI